MQRVSYKENNLTIKLFPSGPLNTSGTGLNPEAANASRSDPINHFNPALHNKKPFLSKVKERAIHPDYYETGKAYNVEKMIRTQSLNEKPKSASFVSPQRSIKPHYSHQQQHKDSHLTNAFHSTVVLKEERKQGYQNMVSRIEHVIEDQNKFLQDEVSFLKKKIQMVEASLAKQIDRANQQEKQLQERNQVIEKQSIQIARLKEMQRKCVSGFESQLEAGLQNRKQSIEEKYLAVVEQCRQLKKTLQQNDEKLTLVLHNKNKQHNSAIKFKDGQIAILTKRLEILQKENTELKQELNELTTTGIDAKDQISSNKFQELSQDFQKSINEAIEQNLKLKNIIAQYEGKLDELMIQNRSCQSIIKAFEERQSFEKGLKSMEERDNLRSIIEKQKEQYDRQISLYQLQILRLQNEIQTKKWNEKGSLLEQTDHLRLLENFNSLLSEVERMRSLSRK